MEKSLRFLNLMVVAAKAIIAVKKAAGEEGFKFFLNLLQLQPVSTSAPAKPVAPQLVRPGMIFNSPAPVPAKRVLAPELPKPVPAPPQPEVSSARVAEGVLPKPKPTPPTPPPAGDFATKLNAAVVELELENKSNIGQFRKVLADTKGHGKEYWDRCRDLLYAVLTDGSMEEKDWGPLITKMKCNPFFSKAPVVQAFIKSCPRPLLVALATDADGLPAIIAKIRKSETYNESFPHRIALVVDVCAALGEGSNGLLGQCKELVDYMRECDCIPKNHWLIGKVAAAARKHIPAEKYAKPVETAAPSEEQKVDARPTQEAITAPVAQQPTSTELVPAEQSAPAPDPDKLSEAELERLTTPEAPVSSNGNNGDKPAELDPAFHDAFAQQMLAGEAAMSASAN